LIFAFSDVFFSRLHTPHCDTIQDGYGTPTASLLGTNLLLLWRVLPRYRSVNNISNSNEKAVVVVWKKKKGGNTGRYSRHAEYGSSSTLLCRFGAKQLSVTARWCQTGHGKMWLTKKDFAHS
jgi:hypothetical protein